MVIHVLGFLILLALVLTIATVIGVPLAALGNLLLGLLGHPLGASHDRRSNVRVRPRIPASVRKAVLRRDGYVCQECGATEDLVMDHIIAFSKGGASTVDNLQILCESCNEKKGAGP